MTTAVLTINGGSSSIKFALYAPGESPQRFGGLETVVFTGGIGENAPQIADNA